MKTNGYDSTGHGPNLQILLAVTDATRKLQRRSIGLPQHAEDGSLAPDGFCPSGNFAEEDMQEQLL
jgi:hypothetical protein